MNCGHKAVRCCVVTRYLGTATHRIVVDGVGFALPVPIGVCSPPAVLASSQPALSQNFILALSHVVIALSMTHCTTASIDRCSAEALRTEDDLLGRGFVW